MMDGTPVVKPWEQPQVDPERERIVNLGHEVKALEQRNQAEVEQLARQGAQLDMLPILHTRLMVLVETLLGPDSGADATAERLDYELRVQSRIMDMVGEVKSKVRQAMLTQGVNGVKLPPR